MKNKELDLSTELKIRKIIIKEAVELVDKIDDEIGRELSSELRNRLDDFLVDSYSDFSRYFQ